MSDITGLGNCSAIFLMRPLRVQPIEISLASVARILQRPSTTLELTRLTPGTRRAFKATWALRERAEEYEFLDFWYQQKGAWARFWMPTWQHEFAVVQPIAGATIVIQNVRFSRAATGNERIFLETKSGDFYVRHITTAEDLGDGTEALTLDTAITGPIQPDQVAMMGRVILARFDQQSLRLGYATAAANRFYALAEAAVIELPNEYQEVAA